MTSKETSKDREKRIQRIYKATTVVFWSIKFQQLMKISESDFLEHDIKCPICIGYYTPVCSNQKCDCIFEDFFSFKKHLILSERRYRRPLGWTLESEIPHVDSLRRDREIADLSSLENVAILRIEFPGRTVIKHQNDIIKWFQKHGCKCSSKKNEKCKVNVTRMMYLFSHLASLERKTESFMVFEATPEELNASKNNHKHKLSSFEQFNQENLMESNHTVPREPLTKDELFSSLGLMRRVNHSPNNLPINSIPQNDENIIIPPSMANSNEEHDSPIDSNDHNSPVDSNENESDEDSSEEFLNELRSIINGACSRAPSELSAKIIHIDEEI